VIRLRGSNSVEDISYQEALWIGAAAPPDFPVRPQILVNQGNSFAVIIEGKHLRPGPGWLPRGAGRGCISYYLDPVLSSEGPGPIAAFIEHSLQVPDRNYLKDGLI
jgi:hypothetical protein